MKPKKNEKIEKNEYIHNIYHWKGNFIAVKDLLKRHSRSPEVKRSNLSNDTPTKLWLLLERSLCVDEKYKIS